MIKRGDTALADDKANGFWTPTDDEVMMEVRCTFWFCFHNLTHTHRGRASLLVFAFVFHQLTRTQGNASYAGNLPTMA